MLYICSRTNGSIVEASSRAVVARMAERLYERGQGFSLTISSRPFAAQDIVYI